MKSSPCSANRHSTLERLPPLPLAAASTGDVECLDDVALSERLVAVWAGAGGGAA